MKIDEALKLVGKKVKIFLTNNFRYSGEIKKVNDDTLILDDIKEGLTSIKLEHIMVCFENKELSGKELEISLCSNCNCVTHTIKGRCGKCGDIKKGEIKK